MPPLRRRQETRIPPGEEKADGKPADGGFQAMDQMANWVRFADTKATILTAGLGVVLTMLITNAKTVMAAIRRGCPGSLVVGALVLVAFGALCYTLWWLVNAIAPRSDVGNAALNRFAWPSLQRATVDDLVTHASSIDVRRDAWQQVIDLSKLAEKKFSACRQAIRGFATLVVAAAACVATAVSLTS